MSKRRICAGRDFSGLHDRSRVLIFIANSGEPIEFQTGELALTSCFVKFNTPVFAAASSFIGIASREEVEFPILPCASSLIPDFSPFVFLLLSLLL